VAHERYTEYLKARKVDLSKYKFYVNPTGTMRHKHGIAIPYFYKGDVVGSTIRFLDSNQPRYLNNQQPGYVFNYDQQKPDYNVCIVVEGIFDAIAVDGVAVMHDSISDAQARMIANLNRRVIVVPDFDKTGIGMIDRALELGYHVSLPPWDAGVKDVNDAVIKYGKLPTLLAILENATMSKIKIELRKKQIVKGI
jgi:DNA primase